MPPTSARSLALAALREWRTGRRFADAILQEFLAGTRLSTSDRGFATELFYGALRNRTLLDFWLGLLRDAPVDEVARDLLHLGLYQLLLLRTPGHAAIFETVALASARRRPVINAVLRAAQRKIIDLETAAQQAPLHVRKSHPEFLLTRWRNAFGASSAEALAEWNNTPAPVYARINGLKLMPEKFLKDHPSTTPVPDLKDFVKLAEIPLDAVARGECYIQDPSTHFACALLDPQPGEDVLDACAAPGGKTGLLAQLMQNRGRLIACDRDPTRVQNLQDNLERLGATVARALHHDWRPDGSLKDDTPALFDRILLDAPCTNTGVMRRRVDLRWRLQPGDFIRMPAEQMRLLRSLVPLLKPGGSLVYSTCSMEPEENAQIVAQALIEFPFLELTAERTVLPFRDHFDGAFAAKLVRTG